MNAINPNKRMLLALEGLFAIAIAVSLVFMPGAPRAATLITQIVTGAAFIAIYRRQSWSTPAGEALTALVYTMLSILMIANVHAFTLAVGHTDADPIMQNEDLQRNWDQAMTILGYKDVYVHWSHGLYAYVLAAIFTVTGPSITVACTLSVITTMGTMLLCMAMGARLTGMIEASGKTVPGGAHSVATLTMLLMALTCMYVGLGVVDIKDTFVTFTVALTGFAMIQWRRSSPWLLCAAMLVAMCVRSNYIVSLLLGVILLAFAQREKMVTPRNLVILAGCIVWGFLCWYTVKWLGKTPEVIGQLTDGSHLESIEDGHQPVFYDLFGRELFHSTLRQLMLLPVLACTQLLVPLPFTITHHATFGPSFIIAHIGFVWYFICGVVAYMLFKLRGLGCKPLTWLTIWALIMWITPCFVASGTVSRYALHSIAVFAPLASIGLSMFRKSRSFKIWIAVYTGLIVIALTAAFFLIGDHQPV